MVSGYRAQVAQRDRFCRRFTVDQIKQREIPNRITEPVIERGQAYSAIEEANLDAALAWLPWGNVNVRYDVQRSSELARSHQKTSAARALHRALSDAYACDGGETA